MNRSILTFLFLLPALAFGQSRILTPTGQPLLIDSAGIKFVNMTNPNSDKVLTVDGTGFVKLIPYTAATGGGTSQWTTYTDGIYYPGTGKVGIGTAVPTQKLHVAGNVNISGDLMFSNITYIRAPFEQNTFLGSSAGQAVTAGNVHNTFVGYSAGVHSTGNDNTVLGSMAGSSASLYGVKNTFVGHYSGAWTTSGSHNVYVGRDVGYANSAGSYNTFLGANAGGTTSTGSGNTALGFATSFNEANGVISNSTAVGYGAIVAASNSIVLGDLNAKVGIGISVPTDKLEIKSDIANKSGLKFTMLTSASPAATANGKVLSVSATGEVILVAAGTGARIASEETYWEKSAMNNLVNSNDGGVVIGNEISNTPAGYKLFVQDGILTEKVKVAINNSKDWADYVFEDGYKLRSLESIEHYVNTNKHLPEVPSAKEMVKEGNDLAKTDAMLLKKIEELTLYVIELKKEINELKKR